MSRAALLRSVAALTFIACDGPREPVRPPQLPSAAPPGSAAPVVSASNAPRTAPLPDGIRAEVKGKTGVVRVEERDGYRLLTIDGIVHAAHFIGSGEAPLAAHDPLVTILIASRREQATRTLVVGLGSGATASELTSVEHTVEVAEIEPAVIDVARRFFDYKGHAEVSDGMDWIRKAKDPYELILIDAFAGTELPASFMSADAVKTIREKLARGGVVAVRFLGSPKDDVVAGAVRLYANAFGHARFYGTGVGDEVQNLYLLLSDLPLRLYDEHMGMAFAMPLPKADAALEPAKPASRDAKAEASVRDVVMGRIERRAAVVGYLVQDESGTLCVDLPHWEMGARRFMLSGPEIERLRALLPKNAVFPTSGDLSTDGDLSKTMHSLLSGGGVKLNTVRFSPVVVAIEGKLSGRTPETPAIPRGPGFNPRTFMDGAKKVAVNAIGEIAVDRIHFSMDTKEWRGFRQKNMQAHARRAEQAFAKGDLQAGANAIRAILDALHDRFGRFAPRIVTYDELSTLLGVTSKPGATCHSARKEYRSLYGGPFWNADDERREVSSMLAGLFHCAVKAFEKEAGPAPKTETQQRAAARLLALLEDAGWDEFNEKERTAFEKRYETLREKWKIESAEDP